MSARPLPIPGQSWPVLPPGVSYAKGLPAIEWPAMPGQPDSAIAEPLDPATRRGLMPAIDPPTAPNGLGRYLVLGLRQTARGLARAWQTFSLAAPVPAPFPPGEGAGVAPPDPASLGEPHA